MIVVWGKLAGLVLGALGGPIGSGFGLILGHLIDVVLADFLLRLKTQRLATGLQPRRRSQFDCKTAAAALCIAACAPSQWTPTRDDEMAFASGTADWTRERSRIAVGAWLSLKQRAVPRYLHAALQVSKNMDRVRIPEIITRECESSQFEELIEVCLATIGRAPTHEVVSRLRDVAHSLGLDRTWVDNVLAIQNNGALRPDDMAVLGIRADADLAQVKRVYRGLAAQFHPDTMTGLTEEQRHQSAEAFVRIKDAYERVVRQLGGDAE